MIVADRKPLEEILENVEGASKILVAGCGTCVAVCMAGGDKEAKLLASELRLALKLRGAPAEVEVATVQRQCDVEFLDELEPLAKGADLIVSVACGAGIQFIAERFEPVRVIPGVNTTFIGANLGAGDWKEYCQSCGSCVLDQTGGVCPIARCSKSLLNGPCGGSDGGHCEINPDIDCAWQLIYDRMKALGRLDRMRKIIAPKDWKSSRDGGPRRITREDAKL